jgi:hypothetical protein
LIKPELNPDWYRVRYNIATLYANRSADPEAAEPSDRELARTKARDLALDAATSLQKRQTKRIQGLQAFLHDSVLPAALLIFAGTAGRHPRDSSSTNAPANLKLLCNRLKRNRLTAEAALDFVKRREPGAGVLYDMACAYAQLDQLSEAKSCLETAMTAAPANERRRLAKLASDDPSLKPLRDAHPELKAKLRGWEREAGTQKKRRKATTKPRKRSRTTKKARKTTKKTSRQGKTAKRRRKREQ